MGFFGELVDEDPVSIPIPDGYQLYLSQVCIDFTDVDVKGRIALMIKTANCEEERPLCILHPKKDIYNASISIELDAEDAPVELRAAGGKLHLSGKWTWDVDADSHCGHDHCDEDEDDDCSEQNEGDEASDEESEAPQLVALDEPAAKPAAPAVKLSAKTTATPASKATETGKRTQEETGPIQQQEQTQQQAPKKRKVEPQPQTEAKTTATTSLNPLKAWKVLPYNEDGIVVPSPKQNKKRDGLIFTDYIIGKGSLPKNGSTVKILYEGYFTDGTMFDSKLKRKRPFAFRKGLGQVIPGMELGIEDMRIGGARELIIPAALGYGAKGVEGIPGNQMLIFRIQLIE